MDIESLENEVKAEIAKLPEWQIVLVAAAGLAVMLFGYKIKKIAFFIAWFIIGFTLMTYLMPIINDAFDLIRDNPLWQTLLPIAGGLLVALMGFSIEKLCVGGLAFGTVLIIAMGYFGTEIQAVAISAVIGVIAAGFAIMMIKPAIILATAAAGAYALTMAIINLANLDLGSLYFPILLGLTAIGTVFQFLTTKHS